MRTVKWSEPIFAAMLALVFVACGSAPIHADTGFMPKGFEKVRLGMTEEQLREARPGAGVFNIFDEPGQTLPVELYSETLAPADAGFDNVNYSFFQKKLSLVQFNRRTLGREEFSAQLPKFIQGAIQKWGAAYQKVVYGIPSFEHTEVLSEEPVEKSVPGYQLAGLLWKVEGVDVLLAFTPTSTFSAGQSAGRAEDASKARAGTKLTLMFFDRNLLYPQSARKFATEIKPADAREANDLFHDLNAKALPPLFQ